MAARDDAAALPADTLAIYEAATWPMPPTALDEIHSAELSAAGLQLAAPCSDAVFVRRLHLDLLSRLPEPQRALGFTADRAPNKRAALVDELLADPACADTLAWRWADALRIKSEFPINLWPNAVQAYQHWVREAMGDNLPLDKFARALLTASGSNFRSGPANFWRAAGSRTPSGLAEIVALTWLGQRLSQWPAEQQANLSAFFSRLRYKGTAEWKEEIVVSDPAAADDLSLELPDGSRAVADAYSDPRAIFADWLLGPGRQQFALAQANRLWAWLFGRGLTEPADDLRPTNPPALPRVQAYLGRALVELGFDTRAWLQMVLLSRCYQQSARPATADARVDSHFTRYPPRRLEAELLADALARLTGVGESFSSQTPEPFTWLPSDQRAVTIADGSISSAFLDLFGRPPRDTGQLDERNNQPSAAQRLYLLNSSELERRIEASPLVRQLATLAKSKRGDLAAAAYAALLSRAPTGGEEAVVSALSGSPEQVAADLVWALLNSKEFGYRH